VNIEFRDRHERNRRFLPGSICQVRLGFTLVELLVVLFIFLILAAIALPIVKGLLSDQKVSTTARAITSYFNAAKNRAIADGRFVGVRIERISGDNTDNFNNVASIRLRQLVGVPAYSGDAADSKVTFGTIASGVVTLTFAKTDNQLLSLNSALPALANPAFRDGDIIEFLGGKQFHLNFATPTATNVLASIDLNAPVDGSVGGTGSVMYPTADVITAIPTSSYRVHRRPVVSSSAPLSFARGVAIDLNYSGIGVAGSQFSPVELTSPATNQPIDILFGPDGRVEFMSIDSIGTIGPPSGLIFLCLGSTDGVREFDTAETDMFTPEPKSPANILDP